MSFDPSQYNLIDIAARLGFAPKEKTGGKHYIVCPYHDDINPSMIINEANFYCFGCKKSCGILEFIADKQGYVGDKRNSEAMKWLDSNEKLPQQATKKKPAAKKSAVVVDSLSQQYGDNKKWLYQDEDGKALFAVIRVNEADGKRFLQATAVHGKTIRWAMKGPPKEIITKIPMRLPVMKKYDQIVLVEGEKCADELNEFLAENNRWFATTFAGGSSGAAEKDLTHFKGKEKIILWADNDEAGVRFMGVLGKRIMEICNDVRLVAGGGEWRQGFDCADALKEFGADGVRDILQNALPLSHYPEPSDEPPVVEEFTPPNDFKSNAYYQILGYSETTIYFAHQQFGFVHTVNMVKLNKNELQMLAPLDFWQQQMGDTSGGVFNLKSSDVTMIVDIILSCVKEVGIFQEDNILPVGWHWITPERGDRIAVLNTGEKLWCKGKTYPFSVSSKIGLANRFCLKGPESNWGLSERFAADKTIGSKWMKFLETLSWADDNKFAAKIIGGWSLCAMISPLLKFRPCLYIQGQSGAGKSYFINEILAKIMGDQLVSLMSGTTEAGIRRLLMMRRVSLAIDENQTDDENEKRNNQKLFKLMRLTSTGEGGNIIKAGAADGISGGKPITTMMLFSSTLRGRMTEADDNRIAVVELGKNEKGSAYNNRKRFLENPQVSAHFRQFVLNNMESLLTNIERGIERAKINHNNRMADICGTLVGGCVTLMMDGKTADYRTIDNLISEYMENDRMIRHGEYDGEASDAKMVVEIILAYSVNAMVMQDNYSRVVQMTIGDLIISALDPDKKNWALGNPIDPREQLEQYGIKLPNRGADSRTVPTEGNVWLAMNHSEIKRALRMGNFNYQSFTTPLNGWAVVF